jgi:hypothetical protein
LDIMASSLPGGREHMLVQKLLSVGRELLGEAWPGASRNNESGHACGAGDSTASHTCASSVPEPDETVADGSATVADGSAHTAVGGDRGAGAQEAAPRGGPGTAVNNVSDPGALDGGMAGR